MTKKMTALEGHNPGVGKIISIHSAKVEPDLVHVKILTAILEHNVEDAVQLVGQALQQGMSDADACELSELIANANRSVRKILHKKISGN